MPLGQLPQQWWANCLAFLKFILRLPIAIVLIVAAIMFSWVAFWFIIRAAVFLYERYASFWWH